MQFEQRLRSHETSRGFGPQSEQSCTAARSSQADRHQGSENVRQCPRFAGIGFAPYVLSVLLRSLTVLALTLAAVVSHAASVPVAVTGGDPPYPLGLPFSGFSDVALMGDGRVAFLGNSTGAFQRRNDNLVHVLAAGDVLNDGAVVAGVSAPALGPNGCVAVRAFLVGGGSRILRRCGTTTDVVAATGQAAPGGGTLAEFVDGVEFGAQGQIAFTAILDDGSTGLFRSAGGAVTAIARTGPAFTSVRVVGVSADGRVGFLGSVARGRDGLFVSAGDSVQRVVEVEDASPVGGRFRRVAGASMNDAGTFAFRGDLSDGTGGVFRVDTSGPVPVVQAVIREGDPLGEAGERVRTLASSLTPSINAGGAIAFRATLQGGRDNRAAIFVAAPNGATTQIANSRDATAAGVLVQFRDPALADDGSLVLPASVIGSGPSLFVFREGVVTVLARSAAETDLDTGLERFRFSTPSVREAAEDAVFLGTREGIFVAAPGAPLEIVAFVGGPAPAPLGGTYVGFDPPAADTPGMVVFGADVQTGRASRAIIVRKGHRLRVVAQGSEHVRGGCLVDFFAGALDALARPGIGPRGEIAFEATLNFSQFPRALVFHRGHPQPIVRVSNSGNCASAPKVLGLGPQPIVRAERPAPGGGSFDSFGTPAVLGGRRMAFVAQVGGTSSQREKLFLLNGGRVQPLAAQGSGAPGRLGGRFDSFDPPEANAKLVAFRATMDQAGREGVFLASRRAVGLLVGTNDPAPGGTFRAFVSPSLGGSSAVFLGRLIGVPTPPGLYRVQADNVPAADAPPPAVETVGLPGGASPLGGTIAEFGAFDLNRSDQLAVVVDLVGASARSALLLVDAGSAIVP